MGDGQVPGQLARGGQAGEGGAAVPLAQPHRERAEGDGEDGQQLRGGDEGANVAPADDSGDEVFVDAEEEEDQGLGEPPNAPLGGAEANPPRPAFHPSPGLTVSNRPFLLPNSIKPGSLLYNFRPRPGGRTD